MTLRGSKAVRSASRPFVERTGFAVDIPVQANVNEPGQRRLNPREGIESFSIPMQPPQIVKTCPSSTPASPKNATTQTSDPAADPPFLLQSAFRPLFQTKYLPHCTWPQWLFPVLASLPWGGAAA